MITCYKCKVDLNNKELIEYSKNKPRYATNEVLYTIRKDPSEGSIRLNGKQISYVVYQCSNGWFYPPQWLIFLNNTMDIE